VAYGSPSLEEPGAIDYPPKFHAEFEVYNLDARHAVGELVLVESPLDVFALMDAGYYAVAFMGAKPSEQQVDLLRRRFSPDTARITLLLSADYPHTAETLALLLPHGFIRLRRYPPKDGSFTSFTAEEAHALLSDSP
jgi:hypothetical protein